MKKVLVMACMMFGSTFAAKASGDKSSKAIANARAKHMSDQMIRDLRLNNYQSRKLRDINQQVAEQITAIEEQYAGNPAKIEELCKGVCAKRDSYLENVLSTVQYNSYFGDRKDYDAEDKKFVAQTLRGEESEGIAINAESDQATVSVN
ncbi:hypothetical protein [Pontibacter oryzae]|uniref:Uncharacterized protein n=1 Tax=Pontibacter oryzae TaxID=2304593 RepID=A0A399SGP5_9BACT|nr:hypothetical protein [Pontibacter oryzae]RIJ41989.1 hypothetical protein D1627_08290 [Pontibacter oryzae]